jgi:hypothetical protein
VLKIAFIILALFLAWIASTAAAIYFALTSADGTYGQGLSINALSTLLLIGAAPFLFEAVFIRKSGVVLFIFFTTLILVAASYVTGGVRDFLLNLGCGCVFLLIADYWLDARVSEWIKTETHGAATGVEKSDVLF